MLAARWQGVRVSTRSERIGLIVLGLIPGQEKFRVWTMANFDKIEIGQVIRSYGLVNRSIRPTLLLDAVPWA